MTERDEHIALLRNQFQKIQAVALTIDLDAENGPETRAAARRVVELADDAFETIVAILKLPTQADINARMTRDRNGFLGATETTRAPE